MTARRRARGPATPMLATPTLATLTLAAALTLSSCGAPGGGERVDGRGADGRTSAAAPSPGRTPSPADTDGAAPAPAAAGETAPALPAVTPCATNRRAQWVVVSLRQQHMWLCARHRVAYSTAITSGMSGPDTETPTGSYHIQGLNRGSVLTLNTGETFAVKYWIPFDAPLFGFHDSPWQKFAYGSSKYRTRGSHGCVHVPLRAIAFLYRWADIGTPVRIRP